MSFWVDIVGTELEVVRCDYFLACQSLAPIVVHMVGTAGPSSTDVPTEAKVLSAQSHEQVTHMSLEVCAIET